MMKKLISAFFSVAIIVSTVGVSYANEHSSIRPGDVLVKTDVVVEEENIHVNLEEQCSVAEQKIIDVLQRYRVSRETEFLNTEEITTQSGIINLGVGDTERKQFIEAWKNELELEVVSANAEYTVKDVLEDTAENIKLLLYEWIRIDYTCDGYDTVETMGFGTDHILNFSKEGDILQAQSDSYREITGYEIGVAEDIAVLNERNLVSCDEIQYEVALEECQHEALLDVGVNSLPTYNPSAAVSYSNTWCGNGNAGTSVSMNPSNYNPSYYYYSGADCCNFVSQCLKAGGMTMSGLWTATLNTSGTPTVDSAYTKSGEAWRYVPSFQTYWKNKGYTVTRITSADQAVVGNPIYYLQSDGNTSNHVMLIVGKNSAGKVLINGHNNDAYRYPLNLSSKTYYMLQLTCSSHSYTVVLKRTASTHTMQCSKCSATETSAHVFGSIASIGQEFSVNATERCMTCGYTR